MADGKSDRKSDEVIDGDPNGANGIAVDSNEVICDGSLEELVDEPIVASTTLPTTVSFASNILSSSENSLNSLEPLVEAIGIEIGDTEGLAETRKIS